MIAVRLILYQTSQASFKWINLPRIPVNPASMIAACNCRKAFFILKREITTGPNIHEISFSMDCRQLQFAESAKK